MIESLQGLRALGMLGIFLFHSGLLLKGTFPVTFFFILSGFVLYYNYSDTVNLVSIKGSFLWGIKELKSYTLFIL